MSSSKNLATLNTGKKKSCSQLLDRDTFLPQYNLKSLWKIIYELTNKPEEEDEDLCFHGDLAPASVYPHLHILVQPNNERKKTEEWDFATGK